MSEKTFNFNDADNKKKEFHASKQLINLHLVEIDKIVIFDK